MEKIKIFLQKEKSICYDSTSFFMQEIKTALEKIGCKVYRGRLTPEDFEVKEKINTLKSSGFCAIFGINSKIPFFKDINGNYGVDTIDVAFYQLILDHPLYHHDILNVSLKNYHVICLDENHKKYIERYYPHIKSVYVMPLQISSSIEASSQFEQIWSEKKYDLLFTGTYTSTKKLKENWVKLPQAIQKECWDLSQRMINAPSETQEEILWQMLHEKKLENTISDEVFKNAMNWYFMADMYTCAFYREKIIEAIIQHKIPIHLVGHGWKYFQDYNALSTKECSYLKIHKEVPFHKTIDYIKKSKVSLNIQPWFKAGIHDRILTAMGQGTCVLTDETPYLKTKFKSNKTILYYQLEKLDQFERLNEYLREPNDVLQQIAKNALKNVKQNYTWEKLLKIWLEKEFDV